MANPALVVPIADQTVTKGQVVSFAVTTNLVDPDAGDRLVYSVAGLPSGTGFAINSSTGVLFGGANAPDIAAMPLELTITATAASNSNIVGSFVLTMESGLVEPEPASTTFYVTNTGVAGAGTVGSPFSVAQVNNFSILTLSPTPVADVDFLWAVGNYDNQPYIPRTGGISASVRLRHRAAAAGTVRFRGPQTGSGIDYGVELRLGTYAGQVYAADFIEFMRESGKNFEIDGQAVAGAGAGEFGKGEAPDEVAKIRKGALIEGRGCDLAITSTRTAGWAGFDISELADDNVYRLGSVQHGTPFYPDGNDFGDAAWVSQSMASTLRQLFDCNTDGTSTAWTRGGHGGPLIFGGTGAFRCQTITNSWGSVSTFSSTNPDGNRGLQFTSRNATGYHFYECVINRNGEPQDTSFCELMKLEGTNNTIADSVFRNSDHDCFNISSGDWSTHARGGRISHCVIENLKGTVADMRDYLDDGAGGATRISDYQFKNLIIRNIATDTRDGWEDELIHVVGSTGVNLLTVVSMHGITIEDATRTLDTLYVNVSRGTNAFNKISLTAAMASYPTLFSNITVTTDAGLDDAPDAATDILAEDLADYYTLNPADTHSLAQGVSLTLANGAAAGGSSTALVVDDARWFDDPQDGAPAFGQQSIGFFVHVNGANREYTAINYTTNTITLASAANWADNAPVNRRISSGNTPNRGYMR
jgi:hypothetical protein